MLIAGSGCSTAQRVRVETALATALISDEQSRQIGEQVHEDVRKSGVRYVDDPVVRGYVEGIVGRLAALARDRHVYLNARMANNPAEHREMLAGSQRQPCFDCQYAPKRTSYKIDKDLKRL